MSELDTKQEQKALQVREKLAQDFDETKAENFANKNKDKAWYSDFMLLFEMITTKGYIISNKTKMIIAGTLAYVVLPIDVIPDFLPIVGWLDDVFILNYALSSLKEEIENFKIFKAKQ